MNNVDFLEAKLAFTVGFPEIEAAPFSVCLDCLAVKAWTFPLLRASVWILGGPTLRVKSFIWFYHFFTFLSALPVILIF